MTYWTPWQPNPFAAVAEIASREYVPDGDIMAVLKNVACWENFDRESFMDDLLQELAGATNIVVQYDLPDATFRAAFDRGDS